MNAKKDAVVYRGEKPCESLRQALAGAVAGETIVLRGDVTLRETLVLDKAVTLTTDGAPRTIRAEHSGAALKLTAAATVQGSGEDAALVIDGCGVERQDALVHLAGEGGFFRYVTVTGGNSGGCGGALYAAAGAAARMEYCALRENRAAVGGAGFVEAGGDLRQPRRGEGRCLPPAGQDAAHRLHHCPQHRRCAPRKRGARGTIAALCRAGVGVAGR